MSQPTDPGSGAEDGPAELPSVISLNVGGKIFATRLSTLQKYPHSMLGIMFSGRHKLDQDADGNYLIDRDGTHFHYILNYMRNDTDLPSSAHAEQVLQEAMYYGIEPLIQHIKELPPLFAEYVVRENIREKLNNYSYVKDVIVSLAREQVMDTNAIVSVIKLVVSKNQPVPRDLQFSKQAYKQYYRQFKTFESFQLCFGKYYVSLTADQIHGKPKEVMGMIVGCLCHDLVREGYKCQYKPESIYTVPGNRIKTISWCDEEFHVCMTCHEFQFNWLDIKVHMEAENNHEPRKPRHSSSD